MRPSKSVNIATVSAAADATGTVIDTSSVFAVSAQAVVTGTSTGTLNFRASNDIAPSVDSNGNPLPTNWSNVLTIGTIAIAGAGTYLIPKFDVCYGWMQCQFIHTNAAAGTITVNVKTLGQ